MDQYFTQYRDLRAQVLAGYATRSGPQGQDLHANIVDGQDNPLLLTGLLMVCLSVECHLGSSSSRLILERTLEATKALYKLTGPYAGYPVRFDPVSKATWKSDDRAADFFVDDSGHYIYSTPSHSFITPFNMPSIVYDNLSPAAKDSYAQVWNAYVGRYRYWEPSSDEILGLMAGYGVAFELVPECRPAIREQVAALGDYLAENSYFLLRPSRDERLGDVPGLAARGPALGTIGGEYALQSVFGHITGDPHAARHPTEDILHRLGVWHVIQPLWIELTVVGALTEVLFSRVAFVASAFLGEAGSFLHHDPAFTGQVAAMLQHCDIFDSQWRITPTNRLDSKQEVALGHLLRSFPAPNRLDTFFNQMSMAKADQGWAPGFPPYLALANIGSPDSRVVSAYKRYLPGRRERGFHPAGDGSPVGAWQTATGLLFGSAEELQFVAHLAAVTAFLARGQHLDQPAAVYHMTAIALGWLHAARRRQVGHPLQVTGYPDVPSAGELATLPSPPLALRSAVPEPVVNPQSTPEHSNEMTVLVGPRDGAVRVTELSPGDEFAIQATGQINPGFIVGGWAGPNGWDGPAETLAYPRWDIGSRKYALLGRCGLFGSYVHVGSQLSRQKYLGDEPADLYLLVNTDDHSKGEGQFSVRIQVWSHPPVVDDAVVDRDALGDPAIQIPASLSPGQSATCKIRYRNSGNTTWDSGYSLALVQVRSPMGDRPAGWTVPSTYPLAADTPPGAAATFEFTIVAPAESGPVQSIAQGSASFSWYMRHGHAAFGEATDYRTIVVEEGHATECAQLADALDIQGEHLYTLRQALADIDASTATGQRRAKAIQKQIDEVEIKIADLNRRRHDLQC